MMQTRIDAMMAARQRAEQVRCPVCGYTFSVEDMQGLVTYWGENGPEDVECPSCEQELCVQEDVTRTYDVEVVTAPARAGRRVNDDKTRRGGGLRRGP